MPGRNLSIVCKVVLTLSVLGLGAERALAYVGPGAGVTFISHARTLLVWILVAFLAILLWPLYALLRRIGRRKDKSTMTS